MGVSVETSRLLTGSTSSAACLRRCGVSCEPLLGPSTPSTWIGSGGSSPGRGVGTGGVGGGGVGGGGRCRARRSAGAAAAGPASDPEIVAASVAPDNGRACRTSRVPVDLEVGTLVLPGSGLSARSATRWAGRSCWSRRACRTVGQPRARCRSSCTGSPTTIATGTSPTRMTGRATATRGRRPPRTPDMRPWRSTGSETARAPTRRARRSPWTPTRPPCTTSSRPCAPVRSRARTVRSPSTRSSWLGTPTAASRARSRRRATRTTTR